MKNSRVRNAVTGAALLFAGGTAFAGDEPPATFADALKMGNAAVSLRYRFETVADDSSAKDAEASTLRTSLSYRTAPYKNFSLFAEAENVAVVGDDRYNNLGAGSLSNRRTDFSAVADPAITQINQAYLRWADDDTKVTIGRQEPQRQHLLRVSARQVG